MSRLPSATNTSESPSLSIVLGNCMQAFETRAIQAHFDSLSYQEVAQAAPQVAGGGLFELVQVLRGHSQIDDHGFVWRPDRWKAGLSRSRTVPGQGELRACIETLASKTKSGQSFIVRRRHLHDLSTEDELLQFVAVMAWGYPTGLDWRRAHRIIARASDGKSLDRVREKLGRLRDLARNGPLDQLASAVTSRNDKNHIPLLGPAFASKFAYAAQPQQEAPAEGWSTRPVPLISDRRVAWAFWAITGEWDARRDQYRPYIETAARWSGECGCDCRPDEIERALFVLGPVIELVWVNGARSTSLFGESE